MTYHSEEEAIHDLEDRAHQIKASVRDQFLGSGGGGSNVAMLTKMPQKISDYTLENPEAASGTDGDREPI